MSMLFDFFAGGNGFVRVMYVFFLGVVPFISLSLILFYYWQQNRPWFISQAPAHEYVTNSPDDVLLRNKLKITDTKLIFSTNSKVWPAKS